jgi:hypothetical protein
VGIFIFLVGSPSFFTTTNPEGELVMKSLIRIVIACGLLGGGVFNAGAQGMPGAHPGYLHALTDLRSARWYLSHAQPGDGRMHGNEDTALTEIGHAIDELKRASIDDGKNVDDHPASDVGERGSQLMKAIENLRQAHADVDQEEDNPQARELKHRILDRIDRATQAAQGAHDEWMRIGKP